MPSIVHLDTDALDSSLLDDYCSEELADELDDALGLSEFA